VIVIVRLEIFRRVAVIVGLPDMPGSVMVMAMRS
jgi:hypothetical protein